MKRTATVLSALALSAAVFGGTAAADEQPRLLPATSGLSDDKCLDNDLGLNLLGLPLLELIVPDYYC
ncbi:hypothetical protein ACIF8T_09180 [Streptomyces sp. NPDC085946]|uniref:hypothetical protein n=1 Tax=Streptomyces sp. NPDC085946 TaxID=3365744 RepID=UPI0037D63D7E